METSFFFFFIDLMFVVDGNQHNEASNNASAHLNGFTRQDTPPNETMLRAQARCASNQEIPCYLFSEISAIKHAVSIAISLIVAVFLSLDTRNTVPRSPDPGSAKI